MAYVPVPVPAKSKSKNTFLIVVLCVLLIGTVFAGIAFASKSIAVTDMTQVAKDDLKSGETYHFEELFVIDSYGYEYTTNSSGQEDKTTEMFYLVYFKDKNGAACYASLGVAPSSDISAQCTNYLEDDTMQPGDLILKGSFSVQSIQQQVDDQESLYRSGYQQWSVDIPGANTDLHLTYEAATKDGYVEKATNEKTIGASVTGVMAVLAAVGLYFSFRQRKKIKAEELAAAQQAAAQRAAYEQEIAQKAAQMNQEQENV